MTFLSFLPFLTKRTDNDSARLRTQMKVNAAHASLASYHLEYGTFPVNPGEAVNYERLVNVLAGNDAELNPKSLHFLFPDSIAAFTDAWGNRFLIELSSNRSPMVWSKGPNRQDERGAGDDVKSW